MKKKLSSKKGESILETLVALLVIVISISFLATAIVKSNSILRDVKKVKEKGFSYETGGDQNWEVSVDTSGATVQIAENITRPVKGHMAEQYEGSGSSGLYYYYYEP